MYTFARSSSRCTADISYILSRLLLWHFWAFLVWFFTVAVVVLAFYKYCVHRTTSMSKQKLTPNTYAIIAILIICIGEVVTNACLFVWRLITGQNSFPMALIYMVVVVTPLSQMIFFIVVTVRQVVNTRAVPREIVLNINASEVTHNRTYGTTASNTHFSLPEEDYD